MFTLTALGGTFDILHVGHIELIERAVSISEKIIIGLTSDSFISKNGKKIINNFEQRSENLEKMIHEKFPDCFFEIVIQSTLQKLVSTPLLVLKAATYTIMPHVMFLCFIQMLMVLLHT